jgi:hypothetical protein
VFLTQVMPFADVKALPLFVEFEMAIYQNLKRPEINGVRPEAVTMRSAGSRLTRPKTMSRNGTIRHRNPGT